jgi:uncharacterized protein YjbJ (UPF0337 family)
MENDWDQSQTKVRQRWGRLTDEDLRRIKGKRAELVNVVSERYDIKRDQAESQVEDFEQSDEFETENETSMGSSSGRGMSGQSSQGSQPSQGGTSGAAGQSGQSSRSGQSSDSSRETTAAAPTMKTRRSTIRAAERRNRVGRVG